MDEIIKDLLFGVVIAAIPGSIFFEVARRTLTYNFWSGIKIAIGEFFGHVLMLIAVFFIFSKINQLNSIYALLYIIGGFITGWLSFTALRIKISDLQDLNYTKLHSKNSFWIGFIISISDPFIIALWITLMGTLSKSNSLFVLSKIITISSGFFMFFLIIATILNLTKKKIKNEYILLFSRLSGLGLVYTSIYFFFKAFRLLG